MSTTTFTADGARALVKQFEAQRDAKQAKEKQACLAVIEKTAKNGKRQIDVSDIRRELRLDRITPELSLTNYEIAEFLRKDCFFDVECYKDGPNSDDEYLIRW